MMYRIAYCVSHIALSLILIRIFTLPALALDVPEGLRGYYKDKTAGSPGVSEGVGPTVKEAETKTGVDIGRRETAEYDFSDESGDALTTKAWEALNKKDREAVLAYTSRCIELYTEDAKDQEAELDDFAPSGSERDYDALNNVAVSYFIRGEYYKHSRDWDESRKNYKKIIDNFYFAQYWDPRGWWWKPSEIAEGEIEKIDSGYYENK